MSDRKFLQIPSNAVQDIRKLYNLDKPGRMEEAINILEAWIKKQNHFLKKDFDKEYLEWTLIASKGSIEKTKQRIDALCTMRTLTPQFFTINNTKAEFQEIFNDVKIVPLPVMTDDLYRIVIIKIQHVSFTQQQIFMILQYFVIIADYISRNDYVNGFIFINDFRDLNLLELVTKMATVEIQQCTSILLKGFGTRVKSVDLVSQSKAVDLFANVLKQFNGPKIASRLRVYKCFEELFDKDLPKANFPVEYGGKEKPLQTLTNDTIEILLSEENLNHYKLLSEMRTDESLRPSDNFNKEYLGIPGSFRNLVVD